MRTRILFRLVLVVIPTVGLMLIWLAFLPRQGQASSPQAIAQSAGEQAPAQAPTPAPTPDPRWVEIVRTGSFGGSAPSAQSLTINLNLTDAFAAGRAPSAALVVITVMNLDEILSEFSVLPVFDGTGFFYLCLYGLYGDEIQPGFVVWVTQGAAAISMTVPTLTSLAYPQTDILSGTAPANAALFAYLFPYADPQQVYTATTIASGEGAYQLPWAPAVDLQPRDSGYLLYIQDPSHQASVGFAAPFLRVQVGGADISGVVAPSAYYGTVRFIVEDASGALLGDFYTFNYSSGAFNGHLCTNGMEYTCLSLAPTNRVIVEAGGQTFSMTVLTLTAQADRQAGQVQGQAPAYQPVEVLRYRGPLGQWGDMLFLQPPLSQVVITATAGGVYVAPLPLEAGDYGAALITTPEGNQCYARYAVPYVHARLGKPSRYSSGWVLMWGIVNEPLVPITVEIQGPSGYLKDWYTLETQDNGYFDDMYNPESDLSLESGDRITLTTPQGPQMILLLPVLTAEADSETDLLSGLAPPFAQLVVTLDYDVQLTVTADAAGQYSLDLSSLGGFDVYPFGSVEWTSLEGYTVERIFTVFPEFQCPPRLGSVRIGGNEVMIDGSYDCGPLTLRLRGVGGQVLYEDDYMGNPRYIYLYDESGAPIFISSGDQIEVIAAGQDEISVVPILTAELNPQLDQVSGQAPPFSVIELNIEWEPQVITATANAQGIYMADLVGKIDLEAGTALRVTLGGSPRYYLYEVLPVLTARLYDTLVFGRLQPYTPYTITFITPLTVTGPMTGSADTMGNFQNYIYPPPVGQPIFQPGDRLEMETPSRFWQLILPWLTARVDASTGVVSGQAPPASNLEINLFIDYQPAIQTIVTATASGTYALAFPVPAGPAYLRGYINHFTSADTRTLLEFSTPRWEVNLGSKQVAGRAPMVGSPIDVTLRSADGTFNQTVTFTATMYGGNFLVDFERAVYPGDLLTMEAVDGLVSEFRVPSLSTVYDYPRRVLEGRAPLDGELIAQIPVYPDSAHRRVRVASNGHYGVDVSDLIPRIGGQGNVKYTDRFGNTVTCPFTIRGYPSFLPLIRLLAVP